MRVGLGDKMADRRREQNGWIRMNPERELYEIYFLTIINNFLCKIFIVTKKSF